MDRILQLLQEIAKEGPALIDLVKVVGPLFGQTDELELQRVYLQATGASDAAFRETDGVLK